MRHVLCGGIVGNVGNVGNQFLIACLRGACVAFLVVFVAVHNGLFGVPFFGL